MVQRFAADPDIDRRLKTTGHQLELLIYAGSEEQLNYYRTVRAGNYLANIMHANRDPATGKLAPWATRSISAGAVRSARLRPYDVALDAGPVATPWGIRNGSWPHVDDQQESRRLGQRPT